MRLVSVLLLGIFYFSGCNSFSDSEKTVFENLKPIEVQAQDPYKRAYFASGCFWCVQGIYDNVIGVIETTAGYSGGDMPDPTYENHGSHAETIEVIYDPDLVNFGTLVDVYFGSQNITQVNGQGPDRGSSYRSIIFFQNEDEKQIAQEKITLLNATLKNKKVAARVMPFQKFWEAEAYHQDFEKKNPDHPYIQHVSKPRIRKFKEKFPELLKENQQE